MGMKIAENSCKLLISAKRNEMNEKWCGAVCGSFVY